MQERSSLITVLFIGLSCSFLTFQGCSKEEPMQSSSNSTQPNKENAPKRESDRMVIFDKAMDDIKSILKPIDPATIETLNLTELKYKIGDIAAPVLKSLTPPHEGLTRVSGTTHKVEGDEYWIENKVLVVPAEYADIFFMPLKQGVSPNKRSLWTANGWFKFVKNSAGYNALGGQINVEHYVVDSVWLDYYLESKAIRVKYKPFIAALTTLSDPAYPANETPKTLRELILLSK